MVAKPPIPANYLAKPGGKLRRATTLDVAVFLQHIYKAAGNDKVGFEDARRTLDMLVRELNRGVLLPPDTIESALWSCNLLDELGEFAHPRGLTFEQFAKRFAFDHEVFDRETNYFRGRNEND
jgi:hypothetical protein